MALFQADVNTPPGSAWQPRSSMGMVVEAQPSIQTMSLEEEYAEIMGNLLSDEMDAKGAVLALESLCMRKADQLSWEATQMTHRPMRSMHLDNLAHELRTQAATWHLVWCLYCNDQSPSGTGGPEVVEAGGRMTSSQLLADRISTDATLSRCASVVTWLESLAEDALEVEGAPRLAKHEGVWLETKQCLGASGVVTELDPDAPGRQAKALHVDNTEAEQRLLARCWQLVRAGRHREARALCRDCGQPWRAASIGGPTGEWGPLPVGPAAIQQDEELTRMLHEDNAQPLQAEEMAAEVELGGPAAPRALWKWTCLQVALQAAAEALPGGQYEAALYGILASHLPSVLPICSTWRDQCWAYCRTWLEQAADKGLAEAHAEHMDMATTHMMSGEEVIVDVVCKWSLHGASKGKSVAQAALAAARGDFQAASRREGAFATASHAVGVDSFEDVFEALRGSAVHAVAAEAEDPLCQAQQLMIQNDMPGLSQHLYAWLVNGGYEAGGGVAGEDEAGLGLPSRGARCLAFGCHILLALEALGVLHCAGDKLAATQVDRLSEQVVSAYVSGLMDRGHYQLVPQYLCHVGPTYRDLLAQEALTALTYKLLEQGPEQTLKEADQRALHVYCALDRWFGVCLRRQQLQPDQLQRERLQLQQGLDADDMGQEGMQLPKSCLRTSIRPEETRQLLAAFMQSVSLAGAAGGGAGAGAEAGAVSSQAEDLGSSPLGRVIAARWLQYPYVAYQQQREQRQTILQADTLLPGGDIVWMDGLRAAVTLCEELALGDGHAVAAAWHLLDHIVPPGFQDAAAEVLDAVQHKAGVLRAQAAAATDQGEFDAAMTDADYAAECAAKLQGLLQELRCWRLYCRAARAEAGWQRDVAAMQQAVGPRGDQERVRLLEAGRRAMDMLRQNILSQSWMSGLPTPSQAAPCDVAPTITLVVTASDLDPNDPAAAVDGSAISLAAAAQPPIRHAYPVLKGAALASTEQRVRVALEGAYEALLALRGGDRQLINISVTSPPAAEGHLTVTLAASTENALAVDVLLRLSCGLIQGDLPGLNQPMLLVNLLAPHPYRTAICTHCCLAKAVLMCARLRYGVSVTGDDGSTGEWLALALASEPVAQDVATGGQLFNVLSPAQLEEVLQLEAEGAVQLMAHAQAARAQR